MPTLIPAASRTMAVFEVFAREKRELSNSDVARLLSLPDSSSSDLLYTLHTLGYLMRTSRSRRFYPTARLLETARQISENDPLTAVAMEAVDQLVEKTNESAFFAVLERGVAKLAASQPSRLPLRYILDVGQRVSLHGSALGKSLLGQMTDDEAAALVRAHPLRAFTPHTITDPDVLLAQVGRDRERGFFEAREEGSEGVSALAMAAVVNGLPVGISLAGPIERMDRNRDRYLGALRDVRASLLSPQ